jgi:hypothetical protein
MVMILLILKSRLRARLSSATLGFFGFVSVIHCSLAAEDIFSQNSSLRCSGTLVITALQSGISESETMVEHYHFERGRRDGLIPYRWTKDSISYESTTQFQHAGITIERYSVVINRRSNFSYGNLPRDRIKDYNISKSSSNINSCKY